MKSLFTNIQQGWIKVTAMLALLQPVALLLFRLWVALAFWRAGVVKLNDPMGTAYLFNYEYQVPLLSPDLAAMMGTYVELVAPWLLGLGIAGRMSAIFLFIYNIIAVISYPALWPNGLWTDFIGNAFTDHKVWGMMLLAIIAWGPGQISLDRFLAKWLTPKP